MTRPVSEWTPIDIEVRDVIFNKLKECDMSLRALSREINVSLPRVLDIRDGKHGKPTLEEFMNLCLAVGLNPADVLRDAMRKLGM